MNFNIFAASLFSTIMVLGASGAASAATVTLAGDTYDESSLADGLTVWSGAIDTFDVGGNGVSDPSVAIGGGVSDGVHCSTNGCSFLIHFDGGVVNQDGADIAIYGLGVTDSEVFDIAIVGGRLFDQHLNGTGEFFNQWEIGVLFLDLTDLGASLGDSYSAIKIIVNQGYSPEEFVSFASLNPIDMDDVVVPLPAAAWMFGSALLLGGGFLKRKRKIKKA